MPRQYAKHVSEVISFNFTTIYGIGSILMPHLTDEKKLSLRACYIIRSRAGIRTQPV